MLQYPAIDPVAIAIGPLQIHWYGLMYLIGFAAVWWLGRRRAEMHGLQQQQIEDLVFYGAMGVILGGRIGYVLFYNFSAFLDDPMMLLRIWQGGMSFHGGLLGVMLALALFARKVGKCYFCIVDFVAPMVPIGLGAGRMGNFINSELWGKVTDVPWGMVFPNGGPLPRHPSMLYEFFLEGIVLFIIVWWFSSKKRPVMAVSGVFALGYGLFRFAVEFVRQPDAHLGYLAFDWFTMGQLLSLPLIITGIVLLFLAYRRPSVA